MCKKAVFLISNLVYSIDSTVKFHDQPGYALIVSAIGKSYSKLQTFIKVIHRYKLIYIDLNDILDGS